MKHILLFVLFALPMTSCASTPFVTRSQHDAEVSSLQSELRKSESAVAAHALAADKAKSEAAQAKTNAAVKALEAETKIILAQSVLTADDIVKLRSQAEVYAAAVVGLDARKVDSSHMQAMLDEVNSVLQDHGEAIVELDLRTLSVEQVAVVTADTVDEMRGTAVNTAEVLEAIPVSAPAVSN